MLTNAHTTTASVHEALCTMLIQQKLVDKGLTPEQHLTDSAYVNAELLVSSPREQGIRLVGPAKGNYNWQSKVEGAYDDYQFEIDWEKEQVRCPQGKLSISWREYIKKDDHRSFPYIRVRFGSKDCRSCSTRHLCTRGKMRTMNFQSQLQYEALRETRLRMVSKDGKKLYAKRAGIEGTFSQAVRVHGLRRTRYRGLAKTRLQHIATAAAINIDRLVNWFNGIPRGGTTISHFAALGLAA